jgi:ABC-type transporter Mla subunit MlaD
MGNSTPGRKAAISLPAVAAPSVSLSVTLVRSTLAATLDATVRTVRACTSIDPAAVVTAVGTLPALAAAVATVVERMAAVADRVDGILEGVEDSQRRVDAVLGSVAASVEQVESVVGRVGTVVVSAGTVVDSVGTVVDSAGTVIDSAGTVVGDANGLVQRGDAATVAVNEVLRAAEPSVRELAEITETLSRLQPLVADLADLDPTTGKDLAAMLRTLPGLMSRVDERVVPAVSALEGLVPVVRTLHENVDQLQAVVNDVGTLLSGLPGAGRLLKRGGREVRSPENKTSITPPA